jgi:hypothetical protein
MVKGTLQGGVVKANNGVSESFQDTGQGASLKTLTITNGIITGIG